MSASISADTGVGVPRNGLGYGSSFGQPGYRAKKIPGTAALLKEKNVTVPRLTRIIRSGLDESGADANGAEISLSSFVPPRLPVSVCKTINVHKRTPDCKNGHNP